MKSTTSLLDHKRELKIINSRLDNLLGHFPHLNIDLCISDSIVSLLFRIRVKISPGYWSNGPSQGEDREGHCRSR